MNRRPRPWLILLLFILVLVGACSGDESEGDCDDPGEQDIGEIPGLKVRFDLAEDAGFFDAPFPLEHLRRPDNTIRFNTFPNLPGNPLFQHYLDTADAHSNGFSRSGAAFLAFEGPVNVAALPVDPRATLSPESPVFLINADPQSGARGSRIPVYCDFRGTESAYLPADLLALLPYQGMMMEPGTLYAAVVLRSLGDARGDPLGSPLELEQLKRGVAPQGPYGEMLVEPFLALWDTLTQTGIDPSRVAAAAVFRTGDPVSEMRALRDACDALPDPVPWGFRRIRDHENYCVIEGWTTVPIWQDGERSYWGQGGKIHFVDGRPVHQWDEVIRFSVTVPKAPMPEDGYPLLFYANGGGGTYLQVVDRGTFDEQGQGIQGRGPALYLAHRGIAALDIEAPLTGPRHPGGKSTDLDFFNFLNMTAFRDNIRQAASEFTMLVKKARHLVVPEDLCPEATGDGGGFRYDAENFFFYGHSTGSSIGDLVLAVEPGFRAGMLSGAGGSWIYNLTLKQEPVPIGPLFEWILGMDRFDAFHPMATIFQTVTDGSEAMAFASHWIHDPPGEGDPKHVLLIEGVVDRYFLPVMVNGLAMAAGLDAAAPLGEPSLADALFMAGRGVVDLPASDNIDIHGQRRTGLVLQYTASEGLDGHYVPFEYPEIKYQYACFFDSLVRTGTATVPLPSYDPFAPCP